MAEGLRELLLDYLEKQKDQKPYGQRDECKDCQANYAGSCKGTCEMKRKESLRYFIDDFPYSDEQKEQKPAECIEFANEFENQVSHLIASVLNGEHEYNEGFVKYVAQSLLEFAKKEQKSAEWNEEDVKRLYSIGTQIGFLKGKYSEYQKDIDWLHALAEKMGFHKCKTGEIVTEWKKEDIDDKMLSKPKQEWSEEDNKMRLEAIRVLESGCERYRKESGCLPGWHKVINWLKSIRPLPKSSWSEEDEKMRNLAIEWAETMSGQISFVDMDSTDFRKIVAWLKSLRPSWKPSEEHLSALLAIFNDPDNIGSQTCQLALTNLYEQLRKLM